MSRCQPVQLGFSDFPPTCFLGAVLTNARASIRGAANLGPVMKQIQKDAPFTKTWVNHLAAHSGGAGVVHNRCEVSAKFRCSFLLKGFVGSWVGECLPWW